MTPLTADEKREIVRRFRELHAAIIHSRPDVDEKFKDFKSAYKGKLLPYLADFENQLGVYLLDEIGESTFWRLPRPED